MTLHVLRHVGPARAARVLRRRAPSAAISCGTLEGLLARTSGVRALRHDPSLIEKARWRPRGPRIRCPHCAWEPRREDKWACACLHEWNTFETGGVCPACQRQWLETQCPKCDSWAKHLEWYVDDEQPAT